MDGLWKKWNRDAEGGNGSVQLSILCNGDETQKSWKPLLNTIFALRGSSEWFAQLEFIPFISVALPH